MTITLQPVKGTRDFYPHEMRLRNWLFSIWRETSRQFGFEEYDACVLESEELYLRKAGDEITGQLYAFDDKSGRRLALRPEMTPTLARLVLQRQNALQFPLKWFSIPQCFRYERMTRGRRREIRDAPALQHRNLARVRDGRGGLPLFCDPFSRPPSRLRDGLHPGALSSMRTAEIAENKGLALHPLEILLPIGYIVTLVFDDDGFSRR